MKPFLKNIIYKLRLTGWLDSCLFLMAKTGNQKANRKYRQQHPGIILPGDYDLYETYQLNYQKFIEDGKLAANEIIEWTKPYLKTQEPVILDWGCGVGRISRHIKELYPYTIVSACDNDEQKITWNKAHYSDIDFAVIPYAPPTQYASGHFNLVCGISVLTHIDAELQRAWLQELHRILKPNGILLITTQGEAYRNKLSIKEKRLLDKHGIYTQNPYQEGHRMMSTYHQTDHFKKMIRPYFTVLAYYDGKKHPEKMGGQDLWILEKKPA